MISALKVVKTGQSIFEVDSGIELQIGQSSTKLEIFFAQVAAETDSIHPGEKPGCSGKNSIS